ncbi:MAG: DM13 domain-containing protein [Chitinophagales bacterium]
MVSVKNILQLIFIGFVALQFAGSCTKENTPTINLNEKPDTNAVLRFSADFQTGPYGSNAKGSAQIYRKYDSSYVLVLDSNFLINNGPALHVYLSKEQQPLNFIDLGDLKSTNGGQVYNIPSMPDFAVYKYALVHCKQYDHLFAYAELQ